MTSIVLGIVTLLTALGPAARDNGDVAEYPDGEGVRFEQEEAGPAATGPVAFEAFTYSGMDPLADSVDRGSYLNPILAGFYPDPSLCRVGDDTYLVTSTFAYFPGLPIFRSRDLVHWVPVGNAIHRPAQAPALTRTNVSGGMFAPTIRHHDGKFYVICTQVGPGGGNFLVTAERAEGPWSDPIWLRGVPGIDPSLFFDEGKTYVVFNAEAPDNKPLYEGHRALWLQEIDAATGRLIGERMLLVNGGTDLARRPIWIEAPHLFKKDGGYVLIAAEGGTGPNHSEVVFRSRELLGPYVPFEGNPILTQRDLPREREDPITCAGHADFVELPNGEWWAVFLACRPDRDGRGLLGRETFLLPVRWEDGWPRILGKGLVVPRVVKRPGLVEDTPAGWKPTTGTFTVSDEFDTPTLDPAWMGLRIPSSDWWMIDAEAGVLRLTPRKVWLTSHGEDPSFLARRQQHANYTARTALRVDDQTADCDAGLAVFQDERHHLFVGARVRQGRARELFVERTHARGRPSRQEATPEVIHTATLPDGSRRVELEFRGEGTSLRLGYRVAHQDRWTMLPEPIDATLLSGQVAGGFTGVVIGMHARTAPEAPNRGAAPGRTSR